MRARADRGPKGRGRTWSDLLTRRVGGRTGPMPRGRYAVRVHADPYETSGGGPPRPSCGVAEPIRRDATWPVSRTATSAHTMANAVPERSTRAPPPPPNAGAGRPPKGDRGWRAERSRVGPRRRRPRGTGEGWGRGPSRGSTGPSPRSRRGTPDHLPRRRGTGPPGGPSRGPVGGPPVPDDGSVERAT